MQAGKIPPQAIARAEGALHSRHVREKPGGNLIQTPAFNLYYHQRVFIAVQQQLKKPATAQSASADAKSNARG